MTTPTTCTLAYNVDISGTLSVTAMMDQLSAVLLPTSSLLDIGMSLTSDTTTEVDSTEIQRTLVFSLLPIFVPFPVVAPSPPALPHPAFPGSIVSSSPNDAVGGTGMTRAQIAFLAQAKPALVPVNPPKTQSVSMNGTTPVALQYPDLYQLLSVTGAEFGSDLRNDGLIQVFSGANASEDVIGQILGNFQGSIVSTSTADTAGGVGVNSVEITYTDHLGAGPFTESVTLNGQTPVNLVNTNHAVITNMVATSIGSSGGNQGTITLMSGLAATGGPTARFLPSFYSFFPIDPTVSAPNLQIVLAAPVQDYFTHILAAALVSTVSAQDPAFT
jgi:hypothetical protein